MINEIIQGDSVEVLKTLPDNYVDMILTSPPYDDLREYNGSHLFNFERIAIQLLRVLKDTGIMVWIIGDKTENGNENGTPFKHALCFKDIGFKLLDTMIYQKSGVKFPHFNRYHDSFEYMFILKKGNKKHTFNGIEDKKNKYANCFCFGRHSIRNNDGSFEIRKTPRKRVKEFGLRTNIWTVACGFMNSTADKIAFEHPAIFPEKLAGDHIKSWSNENDIILDPFMGSGTTAKMALLNNRRFIGIEINPQYIDIANKRLEPYLKQERLLLPEPEIHSK